MERGGRAPPRRKPRPTSVSRSLDGAPGSPSPAARAEHADRSPPPTTRPPARGPAASSAASIPGSQLLAHLVAGALDRHPRVLPDRLVDRADRTLTQLVVVLPWCRHDSTLLKRSRPSTKPGAVHAGATGSIGTTISLQTDCFKAVRALVRAGDLPLAQAFQRRINDVIEELVAVSVFPAAKWVESRLTGIDLGPCRAPFAELNAEGQRRLDALVERIDDDVAAARAVLG
uniref:dihydrodipicolinate synthase family protein n=1 Tax=Tessaracoccus sp. TaxID=1971211 RepID=UPI00260A2110|nr:dihydrodipicolinate synthase family protein [Tessaracoccus sp.]